MLQPVDVGDECLHDPLCAPPLRGCKGPDNHKEGRRQKLRQLKVWIAAELAVIANVCEHPVQPRLCRADAFMRITQAVVQPDGEKRSAQGFLAAQPCEDLLLVPRVVGADRGSSDRALRPWWEYKSELAI